MNSRTAAPLADEATPIDLAVGARAAIAAATVLNLPFGTIYAFSVFLGPMEAMLSIGRADMAFVFSVATVVLTVGMLIAPWLYRRFAPVPLLIAAGGVSAAGLALSAAATGLVHLTIGYGVLFGLGGGIGFVLVQQAVNQTVRRRIGLANGYVVSLYPLGAMIGAPVFGASIHAWGLRATLAGLAITVLACAAVAALLFQRASIRMRDPAIADAPGGNPQWSLFARLFAVFFLAAASGLTVMSQAAGVLQAYGARTVYALGGTAVITGAIAAARLGGGWLVDRFSIPKVASFAHAFALAGSLLLLAWPSPWLAVPALAMVGMGYGFVSGLTAGAIARYWDRNAFGQVAGRLYIAWCVAAISLPVIAGWMYDRTQSYHGAMMIAAAVNLLGVGLARTLPHRRSRSPSTEDPT